MTNPTQTTQSILSSIKKLPVLPSCAAELISTINNEQHSMSDIIKIAQCDAVLTAEIIKLINSAAYSFSTKITSLDKAVSLMGEDVVINLAITAAATSVFEKPLDGYESKPGALWEHDLKTAIASKKIAGHSTSKISAQTAYTAGLLHDIGKSLISNYLKGTAPKILKAIDQGKVDSFADAEEKLLGTTHAQVGFEIACFWKLPEPLPTIIKFHHTPSLAPEKYKSLAFCVHLGDIISMLSGCGTGADSLAYGIDEQYSQYINLTKDELQIVMLDTEDEFSKIKDTFFIKGADT